MASPKLLRFLGMGNMSASDQATLAYDPPAVPQDLAALAAAVLQLQNTVNALQFNYNLHQHAALNAAPSTNLATSTAQAAQNLFTAS